MPQTGSSSSLESSPSVRKWEEVPKEKVEAWRTAQIKIKVSVEPKLMNDFISLPKSIEVDLSDILKSKVRSWVLGSYFHNAFHYNNEGPKKPGDLNFLIDCKYCLTSNTMNTSISTVVALVK